MTSMAIPGIRREHLGRGALYLLACVCTAVVTSYSTWYVTRSSNTLMVVQQQQLGELQSFETSGAHLDDSMRQFSDALVDGRGVDAAKQNLRAAVAGNSSSAFAIRNALGKDYVPYVAKLVELRQLADQADTPREGVKAFQALADLIAMRTVAAEHVRSRVVS